MTTPAHGVMSGLIASLISSNPYFIIVSMLIGIAPDLQRIFQKDTSDWSTYEKLHTLRYWWWLPFWNLHIFLDKFMHDKSTGKWFSWVYYVEILFWILVACILYINIV